MEEQNRSTILTCSSHFSKVHISMLAVSIRLSSTNSVQEQFRVILVLLIDPPGWC